MKEQFRILFVNAINPHVEVEQRYPHLGIGYLVSSARKNLADKNTIFRIADHNIHAINEQFRPHLVAITAVSQNFNIAISYADYFAEHNIPVIMGGVHITSLPGTLPKSAVLACLGESESSFVDIIKVFLDNKVVHERLAQIPGIAFWEDGKIHITKDRDQISNLDSIEMPARDILSIRPHTYMFTSRGCPYNCAFCASTRHWRSLRFFSAEYVVNEIESLIRDYKVNMISFFDDLFVAKRSRLEEILRLLEKHKIKGKVEFTCSCRANVVDAELADILKRMGVVSVNMGLESGNDEVLHYLKGGSVSVSDNFQAINILKREGIAVNASFIIGSPRETKAQILETYNFIKYGNLDLFDVYLLTPYPRTQIWEYAKKRNLVSDNMEDWSKLDINTYHVNKDNVIVLSEVLNRKELLRLYKKFRYLRFRRNINKVISHPMNRDIPRMAFNLLGEYSYNILKKIGIRETTES